MRLLAQKQQSRLQTVRNMFDENPTVTKNKIRAKKIILFADDDPSLRRFFEVVLHREGYEVTTAEDGLAAMKFALEQNFDIVLADAIMPNLSGFDLCRILRQNPDYEKTPLVILTGMENALDENDKRLADACLLKNETLKERLVETISRLLDEKVNS